MTDPDISPQVDQIRNYGDGKWPYRRAGLGCLPPTMPDGRPWPKISIVTPTFNQGRYIEQTILSVANQDYPNVEHIIIDGGSEDETRTILKSYAHVLAKVVSEKDNGQSHAINKGMALTNGEILTWLNSDDMLAPDSLAAMAMAFACSNADMVAGICEIYRDGVLQARHMTCCADGPLPIDDILDLDFGWNAGQFFYQPEVFFTRKIWERVGGRVAEDLYYSMDYDLWLRFAEVGATIHVIGRPIALFRQHPDQKTHVAERFRSELMAHRCNYLARTGYVPRSVRSSPQWGSVLRIAFVNDHGWKWGAGIAHERLAQACRMAGHAVTAIAFGDPADTTLTVDHALEEITAIAPDIVFVGNVHGAGLSSAIFGAIADRWPTFIFLHDLWWLTGRCAYTAGCDKLLRGCDAACPTPEEYPQLEPALIRDAWSDKRTVLSQARAPVLLAMSTWAEGVALQALGPTGNRMVEKVSLGLPTGIFRPRDKRACREALKLPVEKFLVLCTATNFREFRKGADHVLAIIQTIDEPNIVFMTVGHGSIEGLEAPGKVIEIPYQKNPEDVAILYAAVDVVLAPSREETLGQIYLEAAACGTPSLAFANSGVRDAVLDGVTGQLLDQQTPAALKASLMDLFANRERLDHLGRWARVHAENEWSLEASYRSLFQVLRRRGIVDDLRLSHKIGFGQDTTLGKVRSKTSAEGNWTPGQGVCNEEGPYPDAGINTCFRWLSAPITNFQVRAMVSGSHLLAFRVQNSLFEELDVSISCDDNHIADFKLGHKYGEEFDILTLDCHLSQGIHQISLEFSEAYEEPGTNRSLALSFDSFVVIPRTGIPRGGGPDKAMELAHGGSGHA